jgi:hypothetical protein
MMYRPPHPPPPSILPLSFEGDDDAGGRAAGTDMDVVDMEFSPSSSSRPPTVINTSETWTLPSPQV